ncbi:MAG: class I SAM-dependent methyltransferase [Dehalococcoidia bacterium]
MDGSGRLLDVGCGPGVLALMLAPFFTEAIGLDPDLDMLAEASRLATERGIRNIRWIAGRAEDLPHPTPGPFQLVTFGQSFWWTDRFRVAEVVYDLLAPGGGMALISHQVQDRPQPPGPPHPPVPHEAIHRLLDRYLGPARRAGQGLRSMGQERDEDVLARTRFGAPRRIFAPGRADIIWDIDHVVAGYYSMSYAAPHLFGDRLPAFDADLRAELRSHSAPGLFWDWPGDTEVLLARKPS